MNLQHSFELLALLAMGHFLADFGLQSDRMATEKCPGRAGALHLLCKLIWVALQASTRQV